MLLLGSLASRPVRGQAPGPMAQLVLVDANGPVDHVVRRLQAGFLMAQISIPGARALGHVPLSDLDAGLREELLRLGPGKTVTRPAQGGTMVAQLASDAPAVLGQTEYRQEVARIGSRPAFSPTNVDLLTLDVPVDPNDLLAVCEAKKKMLQDELDAARNAAIKVPKEAGLHEVVAAYSRLGGAIAFTGDMRGAILAFERIGERMVADPQAMAAGRLGFVLEALGILNLRRGELENCVKHHNREMCLFPLSKAAQHLNGDGARQAIAYFGKQLELEPDNLEVRWLLNIAAMAAGTYPESVPERFRIGPAAFESVEDPGRFWDVAPAAGLARTDNAGGTIADDFDGDGLFDVVLSSRDPCEPVRFHRNLGDGHFEDLTQLHVALSARGAALGGTVSGSAWARRHDAERFNVNQVDDPDVRGFSENRVVGLFRRTRDGGVIAAADRRDKTEYRVAAQDAAGLPDGELVVAEEQPSRRFGKQARIVERLGPSGAPDAISRLTIAAFHIPAEFPAAALAEAAAARTHAAAILAEGGRADLRGLRDLRKEPLG